MSAFLTKVPAGDADAVRNLIVAAGNASRAPEQSDELAVLVSGVIRLLENYTGTVELQAMSYRHRRVIELLDGFEPGVKLSRQQIAERFRTTVDVVTVCEAVARDALPPGWRPPAPDPDVPSALSMIDSALRTLDGHVAFQSADPTTATAVESIQWRLRDAGSLLTKGTR